MCVNRKYKYSWTVSKTLEEVKEFNMYTRIDSSLGPRVLRQALEALEDVVQPSGGSDEEELQLQWLLEVRDRVESCLASAVAQLDYEAGCYEPLSAFLQAESHLGRLLIRAEMMRVAW